MKHTSRIIVLLVLALGTASGQDLRISPLDLDGRLNPFHVKWDSSFNRLVSYRDGEVDTADMAAARVFAKDGKNVGAYPLKSFSDVRWADIWDAAATPSGGVVLSVIVGYGPYPVYPDPYRPPMKSMLLTFTAEGKFVSSFETASHVEKLALDEKGNIYALGHADRQGAYPLMVKYSPDGKILREFMPSSLFAIGDLVTDGSGEAGEPRIWTKQSHLFVWLSQVKELLQYSLDGELLSRTSFSGALQKKATNLGLASTEVLAIDTDNKGNVISQCRFWSADRWNAKTLVLKMTLDGQGLQSLGSDLEDLAAGELMAVSPKDGLIFRKYDPAGGMIFSETPLHSASGQFAKK